jgi:hypothetical protein
MYKVNNIEFKTKGDVKEYAMNILLNNLDKEIVGEDKEFAMDLIRHHEHKYDMDNIVLIESRSLSPDKLIPVFMLHIETKVKKQTKIRKTHASVNRCVGDLPPLNVKTIDYVFNFGKYKGMSINDINDNDYLKWLLADPNVMGKGDRVWIKQYLKYGFIPHNDHGFIDIEDNEGTR